MKSFINYLQSMEVGGMPGSLCGCSPLFSRENGKPWNSMLPGHLFTYALAHRGVQLSSEKRAITCILYSGNKRQELSCLLVRKTESGLLAYDIYCLILLSLFLLPATQVMMFWSDMMGYGLTRAKDIFKVACTTSVLAANVLCNPVLHGTSTATLQRLSQNYTTDN